jgi:hypothetical protein
MHDQLEASLLVIQGNIEFTEHRAKFEVNRAWEQYMKLKSSDLDGKFFSLTLYANTCPETILGAFQVPSYIPISHQMLLLQTLATRYTKRLASTSEFTIHGNKERK